MTVIDWPQQDVVDVADGIVAIVQGHGESGVANAGFVGGGDGGGGGGDGDGEALVVDTMMFPEMAAGIVSALSGRGLRASTVLNTHHHIDHIGGNVAFPDARIVAHPASIHTIEAGGHPVGVYDAFMPQFSGRFADMELVTPAPLAAGPPLDLPQDAELLAFAPAHTPADVAVWVPGSRTLFTGDLCFFGVTPLAIQGLLSTWVAALDTLIGLQPDAVVPGHGPVGTVADIAAARDYLAALLAHGRAAVDAGAALDDAVAEFRFDAGADWPESERTLVNLDRAMQEARGEINADDVSALPPSFSRLLI